MGVAGAHLVEADPQLRAGHRPGPDLAGKLGDHPGRIGQGADIHPEDALRPERGHQAGHRPAGAERDHRGVQVRQLAEQLAAGFEVTARAGGGGATQWQQHRTGALCA